MSRTGYFVLNGFSDSYRLTAVLRIPDYNVSFTTVDSDSRGNRLMICAEISRFAYSKRSHLLIFRNAVVETLCTKNLWVDGNLLIAFGFTGHRTIRCRLLNLQQCTVSSTDSLGQLIETFDGQDELWLSDFSFDDSRPPNVIKSRGDTVLSLGAKNSLKNIVFFTNDDRQEAFSEEAIVRFLFGRRDDVGGLTLYIGNAQWFLRSSWNA